MSDEYSELENEYHDLVCSIVSSSDKNSLPPIAEIPIDELELLEVIVPRMLLRMDMPIAALQTERAKKIKRRLLAWWNEEDISI